MNNENIYMVTITLFFILLFTLGLVNVYRMETFYQRVSISDVDITKLDASTIASDLQYFRNQTTKIKGLNEKLELLKANLHYNELKPISDTIGVSTKTSCDADNTIYGFENNCLHDTIKSAVDLIFQLVDDSTLHYLYCKYAILLGNQTEDDCKTSITNDYDKKIKEIIHVLQKRAPLNGNYFILSHNTKKNPYGDTYATYDNNEKSFVKSSESINNKFGEDGKYEDLISYYDSFALTDNQIITFVQGHMSDSEPEIPLIDNTNLKQSIINAIINVTSE
jgi:hypothetical protein